MSKFIPQRKNANKHTQRGLKELENSIQRDGWIGAVTVAADGETFDGSARIETLTNVMPDKEPIVIDVDGHTPVIVRRTDIPNADDPRAKRLAVAANRIAQIDLDWSAEVLAEIAQQEGDLLKGLFNDDELAELIGQGETKEETTDAGELVDKAAQLQEKWQVQRGDVWEIGRHRLMCGDSTSAEDVAELMRGERATMFATDPPYGVGYEYATHDDNDENAYFILCKGFMQIAQSFGCFGLVTVGHKHNNFWFREFNPDSFLIWYDKTKQSPHKIAYLCKSELILSFGKPTARYSWDILEVQGVRGDGVRELHTCPKPVELFVKLIEPQTKRGDIVFDFFVGSGTSFIACEQSGRAARGLELDEKYCAVTLERMSLLGLAPKRIN